jgi:hypothetical protein
METLFKALDEGRGKFFLLLLLPSLNVPNNFLFSHTIYLKEWIVTFVFGKCQQGQCTEE